MSTFPTLAMLFQRVYNVSLYGSHRILRQANGTVHCHLLAVLEFIRESVLR